MRHTTHNNMFIKIYLKYVLYRMFILLNILTEACICHWISYTRFTRCHVPKADDIIIREVKITTRKIAACVMIAPRHNIFSRCLIVTNR